MRCCGNNDDCRSVTGKTARAVVNASRPESSLDICSRRQSRCTVKTAPDDGTRHPQLQPAALSSAGTDKLVLSWRLNEESGSSGDRRAVGSWFQVLRPYAAELRWPVDVRVQGTRRTPETAERDWRRPYVDAAGTQRSARQRDAALIVQTRAIRERLYRSRSC